MAFTKPVFTEIIFAHQHYTELFCTKHHPYLSRNLESTSGNSFTPWSELWLSQSQFSWNICLHNNFL